MRNYIPPVIRADAALAARVDEATSLLETVLGASADVVTAEWRRDTTPRGGPVLLLTISDYAGSAFTAFDPDELSRPYHLYSRLHRLWGELLQVRSNRVVRDLQAASPLPDAGG